MYSYTTNLAPQVTFAKRPVKAVSVHTQFNYVAPITKKVKGSNPQIVTYVPA